MGEIDKPNSSGSPSAVSPTVRILFPKIPAASVCRLEIRATDAHYFDPVAFPQLLRGTLVNISFLNRVEHQPAQPRVDRGNQ